MKKICILALMASGLSVSSVYADDNKVQNDPLSPVGYWVQYDEDNDAGKGMPQGVIQAYTADDGTLSMKIVVPLMNINPDGNPVMPMINCDKCGKGSKNGFSYNYTDPKTNFLQGLVFAGNMSKTNGTGSSTTGDKYEGGGVLNPNDGKTYNSLAQVTDGGKILFARASMSWFGKDAHWKRIDEATYEAVKAKCGLTADNVYPYQDAQGKLSDADLYKQCSNYDFK
jgi:hypothetical protein